MTDTRGNLSAVSSHEEMSCSIPKGPLFISFTFSSFSTILYWSLSGEGVTVMVEVHRIIQLTDHRQDVNYSPRARGRHYVFYC